MIWIYLLSEGLLAREDSHQIPTYLAWIGFSLISVYLSYFAVVSFTVLKVAKQMKKAYKYLVCMTVTVILISVVLVQLNGQMHEYE